jgi:hypothetical protein
MANIPLATAEDAQRADEIAQQFTGWHVWSARTGSTRVATRTGRQKHPPHDGVWFATLIADGWDELTEMLTRQTEHDADLLEAAP